MRGRRLLGASSKLYRLGERRLKPLDPDNDAVYWPAGVAREETLPAFVAAFATLGYASTADETYEPGFEKIALFANAGFPTHAARQLPEGRWASKLGFLEDIEHDLQDLAGTEYGEVIQFFKRRLESG